MQNNDFAHTSEKAPSFDRDRLSYISCTMHSISLPPLLVIDDAAAVEAEMISRLLDNRFDPCLDLSRFRCFKIAGN